MKAKTSNLLTAIVEVAVAAGREILAVYEGADDIQIEHKADDSPLTLADRRAHECIEHALRALTPEVPVLSEESTLPSYSQRQEWTRYWLVDPLDGTKEFISRNGEFTVNIALVDEGVAVLGVVHVPVTGVTYSGAVHENTLSGFDNASGAWKSDSGTTRPITAARLSGNKVRVVASRRHRGERLDAVLAEIESSLGLDDVVSIGSSLKMCLVAEGAADIYPRLAPTSEWDTAAAHAVLAAAGGEIVDLDFAPLRYNTKESLLNPEFIALGDRQVDWQALFVAANVNH